MYWNIKGRGAKEKAHWKRCGRALTDQVHTAAFSAGAQFQGTLLFSPNCWCMYAHFPNGILYELAACHFKWYPRKTDLTERKVLEVSQCAHTGHVLDKVLGGHVRNSLRATAHLMTGKGKGGRRGWVPTSSSRAHSNGLKIFPWFPLLFFFSLSAISFDLCAIVISFST